jgi:hypothetical protein
MVEILAAASFIVPDSLQMRAGVGGDRYVGPRRRDGELVDPLEMSGTDLAAFLCR